MYHSRKLNNKINKLHERALRIVYKNDNLSFEDLLKLDQSFTIHQRNIQKLAIEMYKVNNNMSPFFMNLIFPKISDHYNLRNDKTFYPKMIKTVYYGSETISFWGPRIWSELPNDIRNAKSLSQFNTKIKLWNKNACGCRICKIYKEKVDYL